MANELRRAVIGPDVRQDELLKEFELVLAVPLLTVLNNFLVKISPLVQLPNLAFFVKCFKRFILHSHMWATKNRHIIKFFGIPIFLWRIAMNPAN